MHQPNINRFFCEIQIGRSSGSRNCIWSIMTYIKYVSIYKKETISYFVNLSSLISCDYKWHNFYIQTIKHMSAEISTLLTLSISQNIKWLLCEMQGLAIFLTNILPRIVLPCVTHFYYSLINNYRSKLFWWLLE